MPDVDPTGVSLAARIVAGNLRVDAATAEVLAAFAERGIASRLLKGASIARWLYDGSDPRPYSDADLLVRPRDIPAARGVLERLGFEPEVDEGSMPEWWREHAVGWLRRTDSAVIDLHRTLAGVGANEERVWAVLSADPDTVTVAGFQVQTLSVPARLFHLAIHLAQHGRGWGGTVVDDLRRGLARSRAQDWEHAARVAAAVDATAAFASGLRMLPEGSALADRLGLPHDVPADVALRAAGNVPPVSLGLEQLARAEGPLARLRIVVAKLFPPPTFMRRWTPLARRGRPGLAVAYVVRPLWLLAHAPTGFRAWRRAKGAPESGRSQETTPENR